MELVSANTKNYLFLTLSQYNELPELVRARVSMRRDQPFWEGGNSFIACESFRITSAPNEGGLYYQIVPDDFFLGAVEDTSADDGQFEALTGVPPPGYGTYSNATSTGTARKADKLTGKNIGVRKDDASPTGYSVSMDLYTSRPADATGNQPPIDETSLSDCIPRITRYFGQHKVTQGSVIEIEDDDDQNTTVQFTIRNDPLKSLKGPGVGPSGLFCPFVTFADSAAAYAKFDTVTNGYAKGVKIQIHNTPGSPINDQWLDNLHVLLGRGAWIEMSGGAPAHHLQSEAPVSSGCFQIINPAGIVTDIANAIGNNGFYTHPLRWDSLKGPLAVGSAVWMEQATRVGGKITSYTSSIQKADTHIDVVVDLFIPTQRRQDMNAAGHTLNANTLQTLKWQLLNDNEPIQDGIVCPVNGYVHSWTPAHDGAQPPNALPPTNATTRSSTILWLKPDEKGTETHRRGPDVDTMVFTPNEFFYMFNEPRNDSNNPWALQTDENGGFEIQWAPALKDGVPATAYHSFRISKSMTESLGLNTYMEYHDVEKGDVDRTYYVTCCDPISLNALTLNNADSQTVDVPYYELHDTTTDQTLDPTAGNWYVGQSVYTTAPPRTLVVCDVQEYDASDSTSKPQKLYGNLKTDTKGIQYYEYDKPPAFGKIGNNSQVSVESWGTFAGINLVIPNIPFQSMLGGESDSRILASLRLPFEYGTTNMRSGQVDQTSFTYYGDLLYNSDSSRSYLRITTDQQLFDCDVEARLIRRDGSMEVMQIPYKGQFQVKLRLLQTQ